ncbi:MAG: hypothetical protein IT164_18375 [Bryobacterales bacterium]|nr:hypothetical protein [Bryobacterales bacterium]
METGTLQIQIFVSLVVVLGTALVAFLCDFLKGNNEQLRERNIELRVRQDERERFGVWEPAKLLKGIEALLRNTPGLSPFAQAAPPAEPPPVIAPTWNQPIAPAAETVSSPWAKKEDLERLAERAARIRERHEARKATEELQREEAATATVTQMPPRHHEEGPLREVPGDVPGVVPAVLSALTGTGFAGDLPVEAISEEAESAVAPEAPDAPAPLSGEPELALASDAQPPGTLAEEITPETASVPTEASPVPEQPVEAGSDAAAETVETPEEPVADPVSIADFAAPGPPEPLALDSAAPSVPALAEALHAMEAHTSPVMKPVASAGLDITQSEPEAETSPAPAPEAAGGEPEFLRVRVVPIDQGSATLEPVADETAAAEPEAATMEPVPEAAAETSTAEEPVSRQETPEEISVEAHEEAAEWQGVVPAGLHPAQLLRDRMKAGVPFQGVAVSIGINDYESMRQKLESPGGADSLASIDRLVQSMLKQPDFACRFQDDEYVLLFPGEAGSSAQRRLFQISEKLWDFQLRSLGQHSIMFSWGGLEVKNDTLTAAVASARERMFQTKRNRTGAVEMRKRVVNG